MVASGFLLLSTLLHFLAASAGNKEGVDFLEKNMGKPGVITLESGLQYKVLEKGHGGDHPEAGSSCSCHYKGTLIDGTTFDSSYDRGEPTEFAPNQVIKGWTEAMQLMVEGDKWEMYIPSELGYGDRGSGQHIKGGDTLIFVMEILKINGSKRPAFKCEIEAPEENCSEKEIAYIAKQKDLGLNAMRLIKELARLDHMAEEGEKNMAYPLMVWIHRRMRIIKQWVSPTPKKEEL